ncbi:MAG: hypothetical protein JWQ97_397, partial [Phenylobacterium sp.]|nr:hypothetical protein [Phenylobacterium sp.]
MASRTDGQGRVPELAADTVPALWRACVERYGEQEAIRANGVSLSYAEA